MKRILTGLLTLFIMSLLALPAFAITAPASISVPDVMVFRNLAETGDTLYVFEYEFNYASDNYSDAPASDSFQFRLKEGTTNKASSSPYVMPFFESNGYGKGVSSFYFAASDNASPWGTELSIEVVGFPAFFSPAIYRSFPITSSDYVTATTQAANRTLLKNFVLLLCDRLTTAYTDIGIILKTSSDSGIVLSSYGELYFVGAIPGLQNLCSELFFIQVYVPERMSVVPYTNSEAARLAARVAGDDMTEGFERLGDVIGVSGYVAAFMVWALVALFICLWTNKMTWGTEPGLVLSGVGGICLALFMGDLLYNIMMIAGIVAILGLVWVLIQKRA